MIDWCEHDVLSRPGMAQLLERTLPLLVEVTRARVGPLIDGQFSERKIEAWHANSSRRNYMTRILSFAARPPCGNWLGHRFDDSDES